ncbi:annexin D7-like [Coffea eugenioides]|uniref:annexin D7-like n=1 Tax=Coffea eugenioides TaxID=49369 RepID=UPI000F614573|nr:annexin D7-like [Coffea eugenioides]
MASSFQGCRKYQVDCECLNAFFTGNCALKRKLVEILTSRTMQEMELIRQTYSAVYNQDILHALSNVRRNDPFANMVYLRINEPQERDAELTRDSLFGGNKVNLNVLIELLCTRSSSQLSSIKQAYCNRYGSNIEQDVSQKISGNFKEILLAALKSSNKSASRVDISMAMCDAKTLYEAVESGSSVDWKTIMSTFSSRNAEQIKAILLSYKELYGHEFSKFLKSNKCGNFGKDLRFVVRGIQSPAKFFSRQLRGAMQRGDTKEVMARIVVTRLDDDIKEINNVFAAKTGWSLGNLVKREFKDSGSQRNSSNVLMAEFLLALLKYT